MQEINDLSLVSIDGMRHLVVGEQVVRAVSFAVRHARTEHVRDDVLDRTAYRFVVAVSMVGALEDEEQWISILDHVLNLERQKRFVDRRADADRPLLKVDDRCWYDDASGRIQTVYPVSRSYEVQWNDTGRVTLAESCDILSDAEYQKLKGE